MSYPPGKLYVEFEPGVDECLAWQIIWDELGVQAYKRLRKWDEGTHIMLTIVLPGEEEFWRERIRRHRNVRAVHRKRPLQFPYD